jgi:hypothetical protein
LPDAVLQDARAHANEAVIDDARAAAVLNGHEQRLLSVPAQGGQAVLRAEAGPLRNVNDAVRIAAVVHGAAVALES